MNQNNDLGHISCDPQAWKIAQCFLHTHSKPSYPFKTSILDTGLKHCSCSIPHNYQCLGWHCSFLVYCFSDTCVLWCVLHPSLTQLQIIQHRFGGRLYGTVLPGDLRDRGQHTQVHGSRVRRPIWEWRRWCPEQFLISYGPSLILKLLLWMSFMRAVMFVWFSFSSFNFIPSPFWFSLTILNFVLKLSIPDMISLSP